MCADISELVAGDIIEIKYRAGRALDCGSGDGVDLADRWIAGLVLACEPSSWPLVRLMDGQITEVRKFMTWRYRHSAGSRRPYDIAA